MNRADLPTAFPVIWARDAVAPYIRPIPVASQIGITDGAASLTDGFVPLNMTPVAAGGVPPFGQDTNGILQMLSAWAQWLNAGGPVPWDAAFSADIGGYPQGAIVASATVIGRQWLSLVDGNVTNPDTGGAGWLTYPVSGFAVLTVSGNFVVPDGVTKLKRVRGAGGGGGASIGDMGGTGGSAGAFELYDRDVTPGQVIPVIIGAAGVTNNYPANGTNGGNTTFMGATANGGGGSAGGAGFGGPAFGGDVNITGVQGWDFQGAGGGSIIYGPGGPSVMLGFGRGGDSFNGQVPTAGGVVVEW